MAYKVISGYQDVEILMDSPEDLKDLSVNYAVGSTAYTADRSMHATLSPSKVWVEHKVGGGSGSGGSWEIESTETVVYDKKDISFRESDEGWRSDWYPMTGDTYFVLEEKTYVVYFEGERYAPKTTVKNSNPTIYVGNAFLLDSSMDDTGEPFVLRRDGTEFTMFTTLPGGSYDVIISEAEPKIVFSGGGIENVVHSLYDADTYQVTSYIGDYPDGNYSEITDEMVKEIIDHYGFVFCRMYENGTQVGAGAVCGYNMFDGELNIWWP